MYKKAYACRLFKIIFRGYVWQKSTRGQYIVGIMASSLEYWFVSEHKMIIALQLNSYRSVLKFKKIAHI